MTTLLRTSADFDAVPDEAFVLTIEVILPEAPHARRRMLWQKFGHGFVALDPGDRNNGEELQPSRYLSNVLTGFGNKRTIPGVGILLGDGDQVATDSVEQLAIGSIVAVASEDLPFRYSGNGKWEHLDPADVYDGDYATATSELISNETHVTVLYRPGDEVVAGFSVEPEAAPQPTAEVPAKPEFDIDKMSPCAQAYIAEFGSLPTDRAGQDKYSVFRFGFERGQRQGASDAYSHMAKYAGARV